MTSNTSAHGRSVRLTCRLLEILERELDAATRRKTELPEDHWRHDTLDGRIRTLNTMLEVGGAMDTGDRPSIIAWNGIVMSYLLGDARPPGARPTVKPNCPPRRPIVARLRAPRARSRLRSGRPGRRRRASARGSRASPEPHPAAPARSRRRLTHLATRRGDPA